MIYHQHHPLLECFPISSVAILGLCQYHHQHHQQDNDVMGQGEVVALTPVTPRLVDDGLLLLVVVSYCIVVVCYC